MHLKQKPTFVSFDDLQISLFSEETRRREETVLEVKALMDILGHDRLSCVYQPSEQKNKFIVTHPTANKLATEFLLVYTKTHLAVQPYIEVRVKVRDKIQEVRVYTEPHYIEIGLVQYKDKARDKVENVRFACNIRQALESKLAGRNLDIREVLAEARRKRDEALTHNIGMYEHIPKLNSYLLDSILQLTEQPDHGFDTFQRVVDSTLFIEPCDKTCKEYKLVEKKE